jgi:hypothetical protein
MAKEFYTEKDIEDLFNRGIKSLQLTENVVLTELAYEKARLLNVQLISSNADHPPAAPVRPYLSESPKRPMAQEKSMTPMVTPQPNPNPPNTAAIENRIRSAVIAKLGNQVDAKLLDNIIHRVVKGIGLK